MMTTVHFTWIGDWPTDTEKLQGIVDLSRLNDQNFNILWWLEPENIQHARAFLSLHDQQHAIKLSSIYHHRLFQKADIAWALGCLQKYHAYSLCKDIWAFLVLTYYPGSNLHLDAGIEVSSSTIDSIIEQATNLESKVSIVGLPPENKLARLFESVLMQKPYMPPFYARVLISQCWLPKGITRSYGLDVFAMKSNNSIIDVPNTHSINSTTDPEQFLGLVTPNSEFYQVLNNTIGILKKDFSKPTILNRLLPHSNGRYLITQKDTRDTYIGNICTAQLDVLQQSENLPIIEIPSNTVAKIYIQPLGITKKFYHSWRNGSKCDGFDVLLFELQNCRMIALRILVDYIGQCLCPHYKMVQRIHAHNHVMNIITLITCPLFPMIHYFDMKTQVSDSLLDLMATKTGSPRANLRCAFNRQPWYKQPIHNLVGPVLGLGSILVLACQKNSIQMFATPSHKKAYTAISALIVTTLLEKSVLKVSRLCNYSLFKSTPHSHFSPPVLKIDP
ncbi:MAG: hypothetical protein VXY77_03965 [Pseudomonadota bacterium]|nr:hypothetical protein [Pseudomonadota bacterium]